MYTDLRVWLDHFDYHATRRCVMPEGRRLGPADAGAPARCRIDCYLSDGTRKSTEPALLSATVRIRGATARRARRPAAEDRLAGRGREAAPCPAARCLHEPARHLVPAAPLAGMMSSMLLIAGWCRARSSRARLISLATADLIGKVYLRALEAATGCRQLRALCRMLVADQLAHVGFESDLLRVVACTSFGAGPRTARTFALRTHFTSASVSAWIAHRPGARNGGLLCIDFHTGV